MTVAGSTVLALPDSTGVERRITLYGSGHYAIDRRGLPLSLMVGHQEFAVGLHAPTPEDRMAKVLFYHSHGWDARYLGYENLWMLVSHFPGELYAGDGKRIRLPGLLDQRRRLAVKRALVGDLLADVTFVAESKDAALKLLVLWLQDRVSDEWDGEGFNDHTLPFTPVWAELGGAGLATLSFKDRSEDFDDERRHTAPLVWVVTHAGETVEFVAGDPTATAHAFAAFVGAVRADGDHWK
jgi:hypothetical protein